MTPELETALTVVSCWWKFSVVSTYEFFFFPRKASMNTIKSLDPPPIYLKYWGPGNMLNNVTGNPIKIQMVKKKKEVRTFTLRGLLDLRI